jgi:uncharacterized protein (UPF0335 family)
MILDRGWGKLAQEPANRFFSRVERVERVEVNQLNHEIHETHENSWMV